MCIEFPSRVVSVDDLGAVVDREGTIRRASTLLLPDVQPGEWVFVAAGTIIARLEAVEAEDIRRTLLAASERTPRPAIASLATTPPNGGPS